MEITIDINIIYPYAKHLLNFICLSEWKNNKNCNYDAYYLDINN